MIHFMEELARRGGETCLRCAADISTADLDFKGTRDLVTTVDREVEKYLIGEIREHFPDHEIIGEETGYQATGDKHCWIIDPIDGTTSYFHGQLYYSISIAYQVNGITEAGVVYAPALQQLFSATKGGGAFLNGSEQLRVSRTDVLINTVLATGFACIRAGRRINNLVYLNEILPRIRDIRRCGSAALDLAYVAAGKVDGFWELDLNVYDIAAGVLLVEEAGGIVCDMQGGQEYPASGTVAANESLVDQLLAIFHRDSPRSMYS